MSETVIVALMSFAGTVLGSIFGILAANRLITYRLEQLEKKVEKHNNVIERVYKLEKHEAVTDRIIEEGLERIEHLEKHAK